MAELSPPLRRSPLAHRQAIGTESLRLAEAPLIGKFILRARPEEAVERLRTALGLGLPFDALTSSVSGGTAFLWLGPDEWMFLTAPGEAAEKARTARQALAGTHHQFVDVSDYYTIVELAGERARELLMKLTTLDLHPRAFRAGMVTGAVIGRANAIVWLGTDEPASFSLFVRWSMADYLWCLLADAGREWDFPEQIPIKGETLTIA